MKSSHKKFALPALLTSSLLALGGVTLATPANAEPTNVKTAVNATNTNTLSGVLGRPYGVKTINEFQAWRGSEVTVATDYVGSFDWQALANPKTLIERYPATSNVHVIWSVPMLPGKETDTSLGKGAKGEYNKYFRSMAQQLVDNGQGASTLRIGWEMNSNSIRWSGVKNPTSYKEYYRQIVKTIRSVPGAKFTFDYNVLPVGANAATMYPGDAYVDYISSNVFDIIATDKNTTPQERWNKIANEPNGINWVKNFAAQHNKKVAAPEWGLAQRCDTFGGGDNPYFITQMRKFFEDTDAAYEVYTNSNPNDCLHSSLTTNEFPNAAKTYKQLWSKPYVNSAVVTPTPVVTPTTPADSGIYPDSVIKISRSADRSNAVALNGLTELAGPAFIFVDAPKGKSVQFYLDSKLVATENTAPYDLAKTGEYDYPNAFNLSSLTMGQHVIRVRIADSPYGISPSQPVAVFNVKRNYNNGS